MGAEGKAVGEPGGDTIERSIIKAAAGGNRDLAGEKKVLEGHFLNGFRMCDVFPGTPTITQTDR